MKHFYKFSLCAFFFIFSINSFSQVGIGTTTPNASSVLDVTSTTAGLLTPRMTQVQRDAIVAPANGLLIYQTDATAGVYYYNGTAWTPFGSSGWALTGNSGTTSASNFIGTTNAQDLVVKTNSTEAIRVQSGGNVGIGTTAPTKKLHLVSASGATLLSDGLEDNTLLPFATSGAGGNWTITSVAGEFNTGSYGAKSAGGVINSSSDLTYTTAAIPATGATVSFALRTSSETTYDKLIFYVDAVEQARWSGLNAWTTVSYSLTSGVHALKWAYVKDGSGDINNDRVYVDDILIAENSGAIRIVDGSQAAGKVLTSDASGNASWSTPTGTDSQTLSIAGSNLSISGGNTVALPSTTYTFTNGLTETSGTVKLGGTLTASTTLTMPDPYDFTFQGSTAGASASSNILFKRPLTTTPNIGAKTVMDINLYYDYVNFGDGFSSSPTSDGTTFTDSGATTFTRDFVAGFYAGNSGGSGIAMGSIEEYVDGTAEFLFNYRLCPIANNTTTLGSSAKRWSEVYATNGVINTSDATLKKEINLLNYGLKEILALKPVTFKWKEELTSSSQKVPEDKKIAKIGFLAQDLLNVIPEVVQTHSWQITDEKKPAEYLPTKNLGVYYSDIIPVAVKAIQEQQIEIEALKTTTVELKKAVEELKKQNELLLQLVNKK